MKVCISTQRSRPVLLSAYICRPATVAANHPETRTAFVPGLHSKQMWPSSIHSNMCCCISLHLCGSFAEYVCIARKRCSFVIMHCKSPDNKHCGSINRWGLSGQSMPGRVAVVRGGQGPFQPHRLQKYHTKEFNPCAFVTKESDSTSPMIPMTMGRAGTWLPEKAPP